jgi:hypothetical protein
MIRLDIDSPFAALRRELDDLNDRLEKELRASNTRIGQKVSADAKRILNAEVYSVPIPLTASGNRALSARSRVRKQATKGRHGKWTRTGNLKRLETFALKVEGRGSFSVVLVNAASYAAARAALGQPNPPNRAGRKAGVQRAQTNLRPEERSRTRPVAWQAEAVEANERWIGEEYAAAIERALPGSGRLR